MNKKIKETYINLFLKYFYALINILSSFYLINLYLTNFKLEIYGSWVIIIGLVGWFGILDPGNSNLIIQKISSNSSIKKFEKEISIINSFLISIIIIFIGLLLSNFIIDIYFEDPFYKKELLFLFRISLISLGLMVISYSFLSILEGSFKNLLSGIILNFYLILKIILIIYLVNDDFGIKSIAISELISSTLCLLISLITYLHIVKKKNFFKVNFLNYVNYSKLLLINFASRFTKIICKNIDLILIGKIISIEYATIYYLLTILPKYSEHFIGLILSSVRALIGSLGQELSKKKLRSIYVNLEINFIWIIGLYISLLINLNNYFVSIWTNHQIIDQNNISIFITLLFALRITSNMNQTIVYNLGKIKQSNFIDLLYIIILIPTLYFSLKFFNLKLFFISYIFIEIIFHLIRFKNIIKNHLLLKNYNYLVKDLLIVIFANLTIYLVYFINKFAINSWLELSILIIITIFIYCIILYFLSLNFRNHFSLIKNKILNK